MIARFPRRFPVAELVRSQLVHAVPVLPEQRNTAHGWCDTSDSRISLRPSQAGGSVLILRFHYALKGPLAQFGRGAVVTILVEQFLDRFGANLAEATSGFDIE